MPYFLVPTPASTDTPLEASGWQDAERVLWMAGRPITSAMPPRISFRAEGSLDAVSDLPVNSLNVPVFSKRLWSAICGNAPPPNETFEVVIMDDSEPEELRHTHVAVNLLASISGYVDMDASDVDVAPWAPGHILHARSIRVRCPADVPAIFRLGEWVAHPIISDAAAKRVQELATRGFSLVPTDEFRGARTAPASPS